MKVLTWNINSVRLRAGLVQEAIRILAPDVVCLQETKTPDEFFPHEAFESLGFSYRHINGMKGYNGVAILSRIPFENPRVFNRVGREDCRHISVQFHNLNSTIYTFRQVAIFLTAHKTRNSVINWTLWTK
jgi:exodeoxyribonuclease-3